MFGKRGSEYFSLSWNVLARIIVVFVFVFLPVYVFITEVTTSEYFEKNYLATDLALVTDTVMASPNDLIYNYKKPTKDFTFDISKNEVSVYKERLSLIEGGIAKSKFIEDPSITIYYDDISPLYTVVSDSPESYLPVKISIIKAGNSVRFYNSKEDLVDE